MDYLKEPEWKKRCRRCKYHTLMYSLEMRGNNIACYYYGFTGERKNCSGENCDKFESYRRGKTRDGKKQSTQSDTERP